MTKKPLYDADKQQAAHEENRRLREERDAARMERVRRLHAQSEDMTDPEIARSMGVSVSIVKRWREKLGLLRHQPRQLDLSRGTSGTRPDRRRIPRCRNRAKPVTP
jgi:DNA-binding transcriptional regulator YiaG